MVEPELTDEAIAKLELKLAQGATLPELGFASVDDLQRTIEPMLESSNPDTRGYAIMILDRLKVPNLKSILITHLNDPDPWIRCGVIPSLGPFGATVTDVLIERLLHDVSPDVRLDAAAMLGYIGTKEAIPALEYAALHDHGINCQDDSVASNAVHAIKQIKSRYDDNDLDRYSRPISLAQEIEISNRYKENEGSEK